MQGVEKPNQFRPLPEVTAPNWMDERPWQETGAQEFTVETKPFFSEYALRE